MKPISTPFFAGRDNFVPRKVGQANHTTMTYATFGYQLKFDRIFVRHSPSSSTKLGEIDVLLCNNHVPRNNKLVQPDQVSHNSHGKVDRYSDQKESVGEAIPLAQREKPATRLVMVIVRYTFRCVKGLYQLS